MPTRRPTAPQTAATGDEIGPALLILTRTYLGVIAPIVDGLPHGPRGYHTLGAVIRGDHPSQLALATWLGIDRTVMTYLLDDLVTAGLVERQQNPTDRRQRRIVATPRGKQTRTELEAKIRQAEDELLGPLSDRERNTLRDMLTRIVAGIPTASSACGPEC
jgi:MarR family transcriptional regulator, transcriptional regulator for hemolysin